MLEDEFSESLGAVLRIILQGHRELKMKECSLRLLVVEHGMAIPGFLGGALVGSRSHSRLGDYLRDCGIILRR